MDRYIAASIASILYPIALGGWTSIANSLPRKLPASVAPPRGNLKSPVSLNMKCPSKPAAFLAVAACLALTILTSTSVQQVEARAFRHDVVKSSSDNNNNRLQTAEHVALREHYFAIRYRGANAEDEPTAAKDTAPEVLVPVRAPSTLGSVVRRIVSTTLRFFGSRDDEAALPAKNLAEIARPVVDVVKPQVHPPEPVLAAVLPQVKPKSPSRRDSGGGKLCIAGMCGLNLAFASLWVTFAACFVVVYFMDRHLHNKNHELDMKKTKATKPEPVQAAVVKQSSVSTHKKASTATTSGLRTRILNCYQDVAEMSSSMLRQRPPLGI